MRSTRRSYVEGLKDLRAKVEKYETGNRGREPFTLLILFRASLEWYEAHPNELA